MDQAGFFAFKCSLISLKEAHLLKESSALFLYKNFSERVFIKAEAAPYFHRYLTSKEYRKKIDFSDRQGKKLEQYNEKAVADLIASMPMSKWSGSSKGLITFENNVFHIHIEAAGNPLVYEWTKAICEFRLHEYFERKEMKTAVE